MNSYFANPSLPCHIAGGQEVLPNVALNSSSYDPVRHFSSYGTAVAQNRIYSSPFYSAQDNVVFGSSRGPYEYGANVFYQDKDVLPSCRQTSMGQTAQSSLAQDYTSEQGRTGSQEQKGSIQIYPWMQRMNSHSGVGYGSDRRRGRQIYSRTPDQNLVPESPYEMEKREQSNFDFDGKRIYRSNSRRREGGYRSGHGREEKRENADFLIHKYISGILKYN
ncbi:homeobox protein Hox-C6-like isoform X2 [Brienomyrus brachyistius]|uniref:homeobox protein Hox-C6-like isoform X2 n=1 Tax=Brienomyrus brachyistius TaxID=42636 RepID=UPI0020B33C56|nr:homeobox protein Hox-C6-like isoform X2 [Brienomyrus brachyistius]